MDSLKTIASFLVKLIPFRSYFINRQERTAQQVLQEVKQKLDRFEYSGQNHQEALYKIIDRPNTDKLVVLCMGNNQSFDLNESNGVKQLSDWFEREYKDCDVIIIAGSKVQEEFKDLVGMSSRPQFTTSSVLAVAKELIKKKTTEEDYKSVCIGGYSRGAGLSELLVDASYELGIQNEDNLVSFSIDPVTLFSGSCAKGESITPDNSDSHLNISQSCDFLLQGGSISKSYDPKRYVSLKESDLGIYDTDHVSLNRDPRVISKVQEFLKQRFISTKA